MASYRELAARPAADFLNAENFKTAMDNPARREVRFIDGYTIGNNSKEIGISGNGTWYAEGKDNSVTTSYEGIGYHSNTAYFWAGVLASDCAVYVYRDGVKHCIKPGA